NGVMLVGAVTPEYTALTTGVYTCLSYSDCDTTESAPITVTVNKNPKASINAGGPVTFCAGGSVVLSVNPVGGSTYQWYRGGTMLIGATGLNYTATVAGNYKCLVTKTATGCYKMSNVIPVTVPCREGEVIGEETVISLYPNPTSSSIQVETHNTGITAAAIINALGQTVIADFNFEGNCTIDLHDLPAGMYWLKTLNGAQVTLTQFIKQ
ncbi:MAG TPA: T9SS type A sorting domain-containing protein, partial [Chitinophagales bacterium]|nr:T9SS type A sorting domain-containing protein [Chitinophagales bacterium]